MVVRECEARAFLGTAIAFTNTVPQALSLLPADRVRTGTSKLAVLLHEQECGLADRKHPGAADEGRWRSP